MISQCHAPSVTSTSDVTSRTPAAGHVHPRVVCGAARSEQQPRLVLGAEGEGDLVGAGRLAAASVGQQLEPLQLLGHGEGDGGVPRDGDGGEGAAAVPLRDAARTHAHRPPADLRALARAAVVGAAQRARDGAGGEDAGAGQEGGLQVQRLPVHGERLDAAHEVVSLDLVLALLAQPEPEGPGVGREVSVRGQ